MQVTITEVASRDGLQNESHPVSTAQKIELIDRIARSGMTRFEVTSFVSPRAVPALADAEEVVKGLPNRAGLIVEALVPNLRGAERAAALGLDEWVCFASASESHSQANSNTSTQEALNRLKPVIDLARQEGVVPVGAIATSFGCPFEGDVPVTRVVEVARRMTDMGVETIKLGDTIGTAWPSRVRELVRAMRSALPDTTLVLHFHNTRDMSLANVLTGIAEGVDRYESALGGVGGCPFAPGATGNVSTEDLVHFLHLEGHDTGLDLGALIEAGHWFETVLDRKLPAHLLRASPVGTTTALAEMKRAAG
ncbi:hydroxymethylglutaryl-CoA lyase [Seohaeicola nanhaiensis]|uniref:Hydroxymethylglutaryl-CoA lyase n=1 Tax=Seohaeicola nanhaiensis TaxID=1387282 RepID=A0ABV9KBS8_9RHOB